METEFPGTLKHRIFPSRVTLAAPGILSVEPKSEKDIEGIGPAEQKDGG